MRHPSLRTLLRNALLMFGLTSASAQNNDGVNDLSYFPTSPAKFWSALSQTNRPLRILWLGDSVGADTVQTMEDVVGSLRPVAGGGAFLGYPRYYANFTGNWNQNSSAMWYMHPFTLSNNATATWHSNSANGLVLADTLSVYYLNHTNDGAFQLQYSTNGSTWVVLDTHNAAASGTTGFAAKSYHLPLNRYQGRMVGLGGGGSGKVDVLWLALTQDSKNSPQLMVLTQGGISWEDVIEVGSNSFCSMLTALNPDLIVLEEKHDPQTYTNGQAVLLRSWFNTAATNADVVYVGSHITGNPNEPALTQDQNLWFRNFCITSGWSYVDGFSRMNNWTNIVAHHWNLDGVHLSAAGRRYMGEFLAQKLGLLPRITGLDHRADGTVSLTGNAMTGLTIVLQSAATLAAPINWQDLATNTSLSGGFVFTNSAPIQPRQFYRVIGRF